MNKRRHLDGLPIDTQHLHKLMRRLFPKANDRPSFDGAELVQEFHHFGIQSRKQARRLLKRHRRRALDIDREPFDAPNERIFSQEFGEDRMREFRRTRAWFSYAGLARLVLELEFQDAYRRFADERDRRRQ
jgi:hypothetical protein